LPWEQINIETCMGREEGGSQQTALGSFAQLQEHDQIVEFLRVKSVGEGGHILTTVDNADDNVTPIKSVANDGKIRPTPASVYILS
jgi:hypothetical protein